MNGCYFWPKHQSVAVVRRKMRLALMAGVGVGGFAQFIAGDDFAGDPGFADDYLPGLGCEIGGRRW